MAYHKYHNLQDDETRRLAAWMVSEGVPEEEKLEHIDAMKAEIHRTWSARVKAGRKVGNEPNYTIPQIRGQVTVRSPKTQTLI